MRDSDLQPSQKSKPESVEHLNEKEPRLFGLEPKLVLTTAVAVALGFATVIYTGFTTMQRETLMVVREQTAELNYRVRDLEERTQSNEAGDHFSLGPATSFTDHYLRAFGSKSESFEVPSGFVGHVVIRVSTGRSEILAVGSDQNCRFEGRSGFVESIGSGGVDSLQLEYIERCRWRLLGPEEWSEVAEELRLSVLLVGLSEPK